MAQWYHLQQFDNRHCKFLFTNQFIVTEKYINYDIDSSLIRLYIGFNLFCQKGDARYPQLGKALVQYTYFIELLKSTNHTHCTLKMVTLNIVIHLQFLKLTYLGIIQVALLPQMPLQNNSETDNMACFLFHVFYLLQCLLCKSPYNDSETDTMACFIFMFSILFSIYKHVALCIGNIIIQEQAISFFIELLKPTNTTHCNLKIVTLNIIIHLVCLKLSYLGIRLLFALRGHYK